MAEARTFLQIYSDISSVAKLLAKKVNKEPLLTVNDIDINHLKAFMNYTGMSLDDFNKAEFLWANMNHNNSLLYFIFADRDTELSAFDLTYSNICDGCGAAIYTDIERQTLLFNNECFDANSSLDENRLAYTDFEKIDDENSVAILKVTFIVVNEGMFGIGYAHTVLKFLYMRWMEEAGLITDLNECIIPAYIVATYYAIAAGIFTENNHMNNVDTPSVCYSGVDINRFFIYDYISNMIKDDEMPTFNGCYSLYNAAQNRLTVIEGNKDEQ